MGRIKPYQDDYLNYVAEKYPESNEWIHLMITFMSGSFILMVLGLWKLVEIFCWAVTKFSNPR
jgi:hypothetical protein